MLQGCNALTAVALLLQLQSTPIMGCSTLHQSLLLLLPVAHRRAMVEVLLLPLCYCYTAAAMLLLPLLLHAWLNLWLKACCWCR
jgi:hypothetical protein